MPTYNAKTHTIEYDNVDIPPYNFSTGQEAYWESVFNKMLGNASVDVEDGSRISFRIGSGGVDANITSISRVSYGNNREIYFYMDNTTYTIFRIILSHDLVVGHVEVYNNSTQQWNRIYDLLVLKIVSKKYFTIETFEVKMELYANTSASNRVDKTASMELIYTLWGNFKDITSITSPSIIIAYDDVINFNYVYIPQLSRYYFVEEVTSVRKGLWQLRLKVDVLMSYKATIYLQNAFVERYGKESEYDARLVDDRYPVKDVPEYEYFEPTNLSERTIIDFKYSFENGEPNILYSAVTKVVEPVSSQDDTIPPTGTTLPRIQNRRTPNTCIRLLNYGEYGSLLSACISNDAPPSYIRSVLLFPFDLRDIFTDYGTKTASVYAGNNALETGSVWGALDSQNKLPVYATGKGGSPYILVADFIFSNQYGIDIDEDYLDLSSNTQWEIYIPFVGWIQIDVNAIVGKELLVYYTIDLDTGLSTAYIYNQDDEQVVWSGTCQVGLKLPLATTNAEELARQKQAMGLNLGIGLISSMLSMGMANPLGAVGGIMMGAKAITSAINTHNMMIEKAQTSFGSSDNAMYSPNKIIVRKVTHKDVFTSYPELANYIALNGRPYRKAVLLNNIKGGYYVEVSDVHLNGFSTALKSEVDEIESLLHEGVIL